MELDIIEIGKRIKARRKELKLSQTEIYEKCNITSGALSKIENGKTTPSIMAFYKLSQVLGKDMNWLATGNSSDLQKSNICKLEEMSGQENYFSEKEKILVKKYKNLPSEEQEEVERIIDIKLEKIQKKTTLSNSNSSGEEETEKIG